MPVWPDVLQAIAALGSTIAAFLSLGAFIYAMKINREDSINDVRPELYFDVWKAEDDGQYTFATARKVKNIGRGPAMNLNVAFIDKEWTSPIRGYTHICPYVGQGEAEDVECGFSVQWKGNEEGREKVKFLVIDLHFTDLGQRNHSVKFTFCVSKDEKYGFGGAKQVAPRVFFVSRHPTVIRPNRPAWLSRLKGKLTRWRRQANAMANAAGLIGDSEEPNRPPSS